MKKLTMGFIAAAFLFQGVACDSIGGGSSKSENNITPEAPSMTEEELGARLLTPAVMLKMRRIGGSALSPDGKTMVYSLGVQDIKGNGSYSNLIAINTETKEETYLTNGTSNYSSPTFSKDGETIYYTTGGQLWKMNADGTRPVQVSDVEGGIMGYILSPNGDKVIYAKMVKVDPTHADYYPELDKTGARIYDDLMARHWDHWNMGEYAHPFISDIVNAKLINHTDLLEGKPYHSPNAPYFSMSEISWNNAGTAIAYTCKKLTGTEYAVSTNTDILLYDLRTKRTTNITDGMPGYDKYPVFSPDDSMIAFSSMERAGNEADKSRLMVWNSNDKSISYLTADYDNNAKNFVWEGNRIYFLTESKATTQIAKVDVSGADKGKVEILTDGNYTIGSLKIFDNKYYLDHHTISSCVDIVSIDRETKELSKLTDVNKSIYDNVTMGQVVKRIVKTTDGKDMLTWIILPPNFDETKKYPTLLYCNGGPQSTVSNSWSFRWNFQLMAAQGYIVVAPNRRGLPSFGQEWCDQISGDYSGQNILDYFSAIDDVAKEPWADETRMGCVGASYGGYSTFFIAGKHEKRFKALIAHCGMFNLESFYGGTEELWFPNNDLGGSPYSGNATAERSYANSPHKFVKNWDTPILIFTGEKDYRIPYTQSLEAFTAARLMGVDSRLVSFPDEGHQVFKPQNAMLWHTEFYKWLDKYLK